MTLGKFLSLFFPNFLVYCILFFVILCIYICFLKRYVFHVLDPFFYQNIVSSSFATTTVAFLIYYGKINAVYAMNYFSTLLVFWFTFMFFAKKIPRKYVLVETEKCHRMTSVFLNEKFFTLFVLFSFFNIFLQLFIYLKCGIPLFMHSRLEVNIYGGFVIGLVSRIQGLFSSFSMLMVFYVLFFSHGWKRLYGKIYFVVLLIFSFLSGSKGAFLTYIFLFSVFVYLTQLYNDKGKAMLVSKKIYLLLFPIVIITFCIIGLQQKSNIFGIVQHLFLRFAAYGDGYIYSYPNGVLEHVTKQNIGEFLFGDFLHTFRLIDSPRNLGFGFELTDLVYNVTGSTTGPNPRFNLVGYAYFGFVGSIFIAFLCGILLAVLRNLFIKSIDFMPISQVVIFFIYQKGSGVETDLPGVISNFTTDLLLQVLILFYLCFVVENGCTRNKF